MMGLNKIFSDNIADTLGISASLVRKDFSVFGITGQQKGGYQIDTVLNKIHQILGKNETQNIIIIGAGRIGEALMHYSGFEKENIKISAAFDSNPEKYNKSSPVPVLPIADLAYYVNEKNIKIAILAVPEIAAQETLELLKNAKIEGILNFSSIKLKSMENLVINNVNIEHELENLIYYVNNLKK